MRRRLGYGTLYAKRSPSDWRGGFKAPLRGVPATGRTIGARGIDGSAIADVDLPLRAVLVDVPMSVSRLASLEPGAVIPVAVNRNVPLLTGNLTIALGCVGELDDRVALELTQSFLSE